MDSSLIYSVGTARGGTNLLNLILNVNDQIHLSQDPMLSLFKSYRDALIREMEHISKDKNSKDPLEINYQPLDSTTTLIRNLM